MAQRFEHCRLVGTQIDFLGRTGVFEDKQDRVHNAAQAWDTLENEGWELVSVVADNKGNLYHYFKRPVSQPKSG